MKRQFKVFSILLTLTLVFGLLFSYVSAADTTTITILGTADLHGRIYPHDYATDTVDSDAGLAKIATLVKQERAIAPDAILIDCGDTVQDNSADLFNDLPIHPMIDCLNTLDYDVWVIGNHEFNYEKAFLEKNVATFKNSVLSANILKTDGTYFVKPYEIFEREGVRIAVIGLLPPEVPRWEASAPEHFEGLTFSGTLESAKKVIGELEGQYDVLIGAFHLGPKGQYDYEGAIDIAEACPEFSVIFCGHAHSKYNEVINGAYVIEPGKWGWALAKAVIKMEKSGDKWEVAEVTTENIETKKIDVDPEISEKFKFVHDESVADANIVVGEITADFIDSPDYITGEAKITTMPTAQLEDTSVIDLINEVQMFYTEADVSSAALFTFGSNLLKGPFLKKDVAFIYKYPNTLVGTKITGANLKKYMEWSASYYNTWKEGDITISFNPEIRGYNYDMFSGMTYEINLSKPAGERVENILVNGLPLVDNNIYRLALNNYRFGTLLKLGLVTMDDRYYDSYEIMQDAGRIRAMIVKYVQEEKDGVLAPTVDNNWKITGVDLESPFKEVIFDMVRKGELSIPTSEDGRTLNVKALNVFELIDEGVLKVSTYLVQKGDNLWAIAQKYGLTWEELNKINDLENPRLLLPGQTILIPALP
ncbi:MAG TPA: bifunctional metallophosphatase/5'-nucleotidase [Candidatus Atribacteria bacterium]|jgi:2',3'-cyclic-nucleotide 2'-phosphodiesterase/3'-nucleotidase|nr:bifunctional metallophosphatase/5'-nucleotidase [Candidatus Atribacteria bacterium]